MIKLQLWGYKNQKVTQNTNGLATHTNCIDAAKNSQNFTMYVKISWVCGCVRLAGGSWVSGIAPASRTTQPEALTRILRGPFKGSLTSESNHKNEDVIYSWYFNIYIYMYTNIQQYRVILADKYSCVLQAGSFGTSSSKIRILRLRLPFPK